MWAAAGHDAFVLDPGADMLRLAGSQDGVAAVRGVAQQMPFRPDVFDVVYFHLSIHYGDWRRSLDEARRVLGPDGTIWIWTLGPDHHAASFLARWFPSVESHDRARFPDPERLAEHLSGHTRVTVGREQEVVRRRAGEWVAAVEAGFVSTLQLVPAAELSEGIAAFRRSHPDADALVDYVMRWTWLAARL